MFSIIEKTVAGGIMRRGRVWMLPVLFLGISAARADENAFSIVVKGNLTTGSQLFTNPNSPSAVQRADFIPIKDFFGYGLELRYQIPDTYLALGLSAEYVRATVSKSLFAPPVTAVPVDDGYRVVPIEMTAYFLIPVSGPFFGVYMGGGAGVYIGRRDYSVAGTEAATTDWGHGFGIHVLGGFSFQLNNWFALNAEMKFRDLQFSTTNAFAVSRIRYQSATVNLSQTPFASQVHTDGIVFQLGAAISF